MAQIHPVPRVKYGEFSVTKLYDMVSEDEEVMLHLPDPEKAKKIPKDFIWTVVYNMRPQWLDKCIYAAREMR